MTKTILRSGWALALAFLLVQGAFAARTSGASKNPVPALHDGVVVDATAGIAYVMSPQGGIDALDLTSGNVMWKSRDAAKPLALVSGTLVAQARPRENGKLTVVALDARRGTAQRSTDIDIPKALRANVADGPSQTFRAQAYPAGKSGVVVTWTAENVLPQGYVQEVPEGPVADSPAAKRAAEAATAATRPQRGAVRLDVAAGSTAPLSWEEAQQAAPALSVREIAEKAGGAAAARRQLVSLDGRHVLTSEPSGERNPWAAYRWTVTTTSGATVGTLEAPVSMAPFVVSGSKILYVAQPSVRQDGGKWLQEPLRLRALDLKTGVELWAAPIVDSNYRGPFPP
ncbi:MAG TPA: hypothetical protein VHC97_19840 [Thermoanaerobaculia bacterium]|nr:hypothetical protein [Thermoanaerobaculia bacterium]